MKFRKPYPSNPTEDLSELRAAIHHNEDETAQFKIELMFGTTALALDEKIFEISIKEAILGLRYEGVEIELGSKYGQRRRENEIDTTVTATVEGVGKAGARAGVGSKATATTTSTPSGELTADAGLEFKLSKQKTELRRTEYTEKAQRARALGGDRWRISEVDGQSLDGNYIYDEPLCTFRSVDGANRQEITAIVSVRQRDLHIAPNPERMPLLGRTRNREKLFAILLAKSIHKHLDPENAYEGVLNVSVVHCENDDQPAT